MTPEQRKSHRESQDEEWKVRREQIATDSTELKKLVGIGAFVISEETSNEEDDPVEGAEAYQRITRECLDGVREAARRDLRLLP